MKLPCRCMLFDLDGTLVDTAPDLGHAANFVRQQRGLPPLPLPDYRPVASAGARGLLRVALDLAPEHPDYAGCREQLLRHYSENLSRHSRMFDGMDEVLQGLAARGVAAGVVTNKPAWLTRPLLDALGLSRRLACAVSGDEVARAKPAPDSLLLACTITGLPPAACVYVGDDHRDIVAGRAAGMATIAADWGYLGDDGPIEAWAATHIARAPADLLALIA